MMRRESGTPEHFVLVSLVRGDDSPPQEISSLSNWEWRRDPMNHRCGADASARQFGLLHRKYA